MTFDGINTNYAVEIPGGEGGLGFPALQALTYQPRSLSESVPICLSAESVDKLTEEAHGMIQWDIKVTNFGGEDVAVHCIASEVRWVILGVPKLYMMDKGSKTVCALPAGKLPPNHVTATRLFLLGVVGDKILKDANGDPQVFTLKLTSTKTKLVAGSRTDKTGSIVALNDAVLKHYGKKGRVSMVHLVSVMLKVDVQRITSQHNGESSIGILFAIEKAKPLPQSLQGEVYTMVRSEFIQGLLKDPFLLDRKEVPQQSQQNNTEEPLPMDDDIPF